MRAYLSESSDEVLHVSSIPKVQLNEPGPAGIMGAEGIEQVWFLPLQTSWIIFNLMAEAYAVMDSFKLDLKAYAI